MFINCQNQEFLITGGISEVCEPLVIIYKKITYLKKYRGVC